jgi:Ca-activated chloride channel homolog
MNNPLLSILVLSFFWLWAQAVSAQTLPPTLRQPATTNSDSAKNQAVTPGANEPDVDENDVVRVSTSLITVPAEVVDHGGRYIGHLRKEDFHIYEEGVEQEVTYFASVTQPFTLALILDVSGSTQTQLQAIRNAANNFINRLRPNDRILIVSFDGRINVLTEAVTLGQLRKQKIRLDALNEGTLLYDAVSVVLNERLARIPGRKAIVLFTDGVDSGSKRASYKQTLRDAEEANVIIYPVKYNTLPQLPERLRQIADPRARDRVQARMIKEYATGSAYLRALADKTGGRLYRAESLTDIPQAFALVTEDLGRQYSLGYYPKTQARPGEKRDIIVRVRVPNLIVRARESYVAKGSTNGTLH